MSDEAKRHREAAAAHEGVAYIGRMTSKPLRPTPAELLTAIEAAGGALSIPSPSRSNRASYRRTIHYVINSDLLGSDRRLRYTGRDSGDLVISIVSVDNELPPKVTPDPVPVPATLRRCHALVQAVRDVRPHDHWIDTTRTPNAAHLRIHVASHKRSLCLLQAVIDEAERRGHSVGKATHCSGLAIVVNSHPIEVTVKEKSTRVARQPGVVREHGLRYMYGTADWTYSPTGDLEIRSGHGSLGSLLASEGRRWRLEDRLWKVFERLDALAAKEEEWRQRRLRDEQEREARREAALAQAREAFLLQWRVDFLKRQIDRWRLVEEARQFVSEVRHRQTTADEEQWLSWIVSYVEQIDPINRIVAPPDPPEPGVADLQPYLPNRSLALW